MKRRLSALAVQKAAPGLLGLVLILSAAAAPASGDELGDAFDRGMRFYHEQRYAEAVPFFEQALTLSEARYGSDDPVIALDLHNLAEVYRLTGQLDEAETLYLRAIALEKQRDPQDPVGLATSYNNLALVYREQNRLAEAERLYKQALTMLENGLGVHHPNVARNLNNLAMVYAAQGYNDRARTLLDQAVSISSDVLGPTHPTSMALAKNRETVSGEARPADLPPPERRPQVTAVSARSPASGTIPENGLPPPDLRPAGVTAAALASDEILLHLASVRSVESANAEWKRLSSLYQLPGSIRQAKAERIVIEGQGIFYRVAGIGFSGLDEARDVCRGIRERGDFCQVIVAN